MSKQEDKMDTIQKHPMEQFHAFERRPVGAGVRVGRRMTLGGVFGVVVDTLMTWQERVIMRHQLAGLPDDLLNDMGITDAERDREASKPFWRE